VLVAKAADAEPVLAAQAADAGRVLVAKVAPAGRVLGAARVQTDAVRALQTATAVQVARATVAVATPRAVDVPRAGDAAHRVPMVMRVDATEAPEADAAAKDMVMQRGPASQTRVQMPVRGPRRPAPRRGVVCNAREQARRLRRVPHPLRRRPRAISSTVACRT
jgi:hypothetical protein